MNNYHRLRIAGTDETAALELPEQVQLAVDDLAGEMREGLLALSVGVGMKVMNELIEEELAHPCGPKGKHDPKRSAHRHGSRGSSVVLGGRKVSARRPRARSTEGSELPIRTWELFSSEDLLSERTVETMLAGLSTRRYRSGLEPTGTEDRSSSRSAISRRFVPRTRERLGELMSPSGARGSGRAHARRRPGSRAHLRGRARDRLRGLQAPARALGGGDREQGGLSARPRRLGRGAGGDRRREGAGQGRRAVLGRGAVVQRCQRHSVPRAWAPRVEEVMRHELIHAQARVRQPVEVRSR